MSIENELMSRMKEAMKAKRERELSVLRMIKAQAQIEKSAPGFGGTTDDAFWTGVVSRYVKQQKRALVEFEKAGEEGKNQAEGVSFEIEYLSEFLPKKLGEDAMRALVKESIQSLGVQSSKMAGKVIGHIMQGHRDEVDAAVLKRLVEEELG